MQHVLGWLKRGGRGIDTAQSYANHRQISTAFLSSSKKQRRDTFVSTKVKCHPNVTAATAVAISMFELRVGALDQVLLHMPCTTVAATQLAWQGLQQTHRLGLTKTIGVSNFPARLVSLLKAMGRPYPTLNQLQMSVGSHHRSEVKEIAGFGVTVQAYSPLLGLQALKRNPTVIAATRRTGKSAAQVMLRWLTQRSIPVVTSPGSDKHMVESLGGALNFSLTANELEELGNVQVGCPSYRNCKLLAGVQNKWILAPKCCKR